MNIQIGEKILLFTKQRYIKIFAYYQEFRLRITGDVDAYAKDFHFLIRKKKRAKEKYCLFKIGTVGPSLGWMARNYIYICEWLIPQGLIPIIDMEYQYSLDQGRIGEENQWEYVFCQPVSVKDIDKQEYVIVKEGIEGICYPKKVCMDINGQEDDVYFHMEEQNWREYYTNISKYVKKYWIFRKEIIDDFEENYGIHFKKKKIMGVFLKEDFTPDVYDTMDDIERSVYDSHPKHPNVVTIIDIVKEYMNKWGCDSIFLSTIYQDSVEQFYKEFGDKVFTVDRKRIRLEDRKKLARYSDTNEEKYQKNKELVDSKNRTVTYMQEIIGLSHCEYFLTMKAGGAIMALALNGGIYNDIHILPDSNGSIMY